LDSSLISIQSKKKGLESFLNPFQMIQNTSATSSVNHHWIAAYYGDLVDTSSQIPALNERSDLIVLDTPIAPNLKKAWVKYTSFLLDEFGEQITQTILEDSILFKVSERFYLDCVELTGT